jgi:RimJ/RimL family protein N-acetyltransferase
MGKHTGKFSARIQYMAWVRCNGHCEGEGCGIKLKAGGFEYDHNTPKEMSADDGCINMHGMRIPVDDLENCRVLCKDCHSRKTHGTDRPNISRANKRRNTHFGISSKNPGRALPGTKRSGFKKKMDGTVEHRNNHRKYFTLKTVGLENLSGTHSARSYRTLTDGVVLVRHYASVDHAVLKALNDKEHMKYSEQRHRDHTVGSQRRYLDDMLFGGNLALGIFIQNNEEYTTLVGTMGCTTDRNNELLDMGIMMLPGHTGKGYALCAWRLVLKWALDHEGGAFQKVEAGCHADNSAMRTICERTGMEFEGTRLQHFLNKDGTRSNLLFWGALK